MGGRRPGHSQVSSTKNTIKEPHSLLCDDTRGTSGGRATLHQSTLILYKSGETTETKERCSPLFFFLVHKHLISLVCRGHPGGGTYHGDRLGRDVLSTV